MFRFVCNFQNYPRPTFVIFPCEGTYGYVISVVSVEDDDIRPGLIDIDTGAVNVSVYYTVILLRPFKNEVLDAIGEENNLSFILIFSVSFSHRISSVTMASDETGFFARVGPLQIFVSRHSMPEDITVMIFFQNRIRHHILDCINCTNSSTPRLPIAGFRRTKRWKYVRDRS
jgi:hypothetical protein